MSSLLDFNFSPCICISEMDSQSTAGRQQVQHHHNEQVSYRIFLFFGRRNPTRDLQVVYGLLAFLIGATMVSFGDLRNFSIFIRALRFKDKLYTREIWFAHIFFPSHFSKDMAKVNIFYEQLDYYSWDESPEYNVSWGNSSLMYALYARKTTRFEATNCTVHVFIWGFR